jgi:hypothetical protein
VPARSGQRRSIEHRASSGLSLGLSSSLTSQSSAYCEPPQILRLRPLCTRVAALPSTYGSRGWGFESLRARPSSSVIAGLLPPARSLAARWNVRCVPAGARVLADRGCERAFGSLAVQRSADPVRRVPLAGRQRVGVRPQRDAGSLWPSRRPRCGPDRSPRPASITRPDWSSAVPAMKAAASCGTPIHQGGQCDVYRRLQRRLEGVDRCSYC